MTLFVLDGKKLSSSYNMQYQEKNIKKLNKSIHLTNFLDDLVHYPLYPMQVKMGIANLQSNIFYNRLIV